MFQARRAIETTIGRNVVQHATDDDLALLHAHVDTEKAARGIGTRPDVIRLSREFHVLLGQIGRNQVLARYLDELTMRSSLIIGLYGTGGTLCADDEHARIVAAIEARNEDEVIRLIDMHLRHIEEGIAFSETVPQSGFLSSILTAPA